VNILLLVVLSAYLTLWDLMRKTEMRLGEEEEEEERRVSGRGDGTSGVTKCESVWECLLNPLFFIYYSLTLAAAVDIKDSDH